MNALQAQTLYAMCQLHIKSVHYNNAVLVT